MNTKILSGNQLKLIAAIAMVVDHFAVIFCPQNSILRIIGRLAFPIFAFMISEGARYTSSKLKYLLTMFSVAAVCQIAYIIYGQFEPFNILITFSLSTVMIFALQNYKSKLFDTKSNKAQITVSFLAFCFAVALVYYLNTLVLIDYGFAGCMVPVAASLFDFRGIKAPKSLKKLDKTPLCVLCIIVPISFIIYRNMSLGDKYVSPFLLMAIPLLMLYSGKRGGKKLKYFFYLFYPLHLALLEGIYMLINM